MRHNTTLTPAQQSLNEEILHSPLLALPCETRKAMLKCQDPQACAFIDLLISRRYGASPLEALNDTQNATKKQVKMMTNMGADWEGMYNAFANYDVNKCTENGFFAYADTCCRNAQKEEYRQESNAHRVKKLSNKDSQLLRKILAHIENDCQKTIADALQSPAFCQEVADVFKIHKKKLFDLLSAREYVLSLDATFDDGSSQFEAADNTDIPLAVEEKEIEQFATILKLFNLEQKEAYAQKQGLYWSKTLIGYLRGNEAYKGNNRKKDAPTQEKAKIDPAQEVVNRDEKLARCDDLAPLDEANCLWDMLLLEEFVQFLIAEPLPPRKLPPVALNPLKDPDMPPSNKALAAYLGISESAASQRTKKWKATLYETLCKLADEA